MPGRHSESSDLGGGNFGSGMNFGGSANFDGGSGGWRPQGPWNPGGGSFGWGWMLLSILPWFFGRGNTGPRFGRGGGGGCGCGCGGIGCLIVLGVFVLCVASGGISFGLNRGGFSNNNPRNVPVATSRSGSLSSERPSVQTQTARDLRELTQAFDQRIPEWQRTLATNEWHSISGPDAGLTQDNNTKEVVYGKCGTALYVFVVLRTRPDVGPADAEGYAYTNAISPASCRPPTYAVYDSQEVGRGWWFVTLRYDPSGIQGR
jgi:hypothetical protein